MKNRNYLLFTIIFVLMIVTLNAQNSEDFNGGYEQVYQTFGVEQATVNMQKTTQQKIQKAILQLAMKQKSSSRPKSISPKSVAFFSPSSTSDNFKIIADTVGQDAEQRTLFKQLFAETKKGFDAELAPKGRKNNLAAAMAFFIGTTVTIYNDDPEPSEEAMENLFQALTAMYEETPGMAEVPNKDKQFLHDTLVSFSGMPLAFYVEAKEKNDPEMMKLAKVVAGALLLEILKINPNDVRFEGNTLKFKNAQNTNQTPVQQSDVKRGIAKYTTTFNDGWVATALNDYVQLQNNGMEIRLFYVNKEWDDSRLNTVEPTDHYWAKTVLPYFNVSNVQRWSGVEYPVIYFLQADAVDKKTGKLSFITMKIIYEGGARVIVTIAPNKATYQQQFAHPNDLNKMLNANRFAVTAQDLNGTWSGGGGVEYYNAYGYAEMSAISTSDEFVFASNGSYQSTHDSANMRGGGTRFAKVQYKGKFTANDWELFATNRVSGKTKKFLCQFEAVRGGFLLKLTDGDYEPLKYTLFKKS